MIKPHIFVTEWPLVRGSDIKCVCGEIVQYATEVFSWLDATGPDYSDFVTSFNTCDQCLEALNARAPEAGRQYIYGLVPQQEGFDAERKYQEMVA